MTAWKKRAVKERMNLVKALARWRNIREISQVDLCRKVGSAQAQLSRIESGTAGVTLGLVFDLGKALDCELMLVPKELHRQVASAVDRFTEQCELDLGPRGPVGRKRGTESRNRMPIGLNGNRGPGSSEMRV